MGPVARVLPSSIIAVAACAALFGCQADRADDTGEPDPALGDPTINARLGLERSTLIRPEIHEEIDGVLRVTLPIEGIDRNVVLEPVSIRSNDYALFVQTSNGIERIPATDSRTVQGHIEGLPGSIVTGSYMEDGLHARVALEPGHVYWTEPTLRVREDVSDQYVLYRDEDVIDAPKTCGLNDVVQVPFDDSGALSLAAETAAVGGLAIVELALDADFEFFQAHGTVDNAVARMEAVITAINQQYEGEVGIRHVISAAIVRTTADDPYTSTDPLTMLQDELRPQWLNNHGDIQRDLVHLFTGKDLDGSTIGIAFVGAVCGSFGFGLSQSDFTSNFACVTDLTAHELGHNWDAEHCDCTGNTMNPSLTCSNTFNADLSVPAIENHRDTRSCLDFGDECPDDPNKLEAGQCGCGVEDVDTDLDGVADCLDTCPEDPNKSEPGQCGCGIEDSHSDTDGTADCNDGCPTDPNKLEPGQCGCGAVDTDSDGDGTADCNDGCPDDPNATDPSLCQSPVCGDGVCDAGEAPCSCPEDCDAAVAELSCGDGLDDDCDGLIDCADPDCEADAQCTTVCTADADACIDGADCCSGKCSGKRGSRTCGSTGGQGGGSDVCALEGESCKNNGQCCSRECSRGSAGDKTCLPAPGGALQSLLEDEDPDEAAPAAGGTLVGGCNLGADGRPDGGLWLWAAVAIFALCRRRSQAQGERGSR